MSRSQNVNRKAAKLQHASNSSSTFSSGAAAFGDNKIVRLSQLVYQRDKIVVEALFAVRFEIQMWQVAGCKLLLWLLLLLLGNNLNKQNALSADCSRCWPQQVSVLAANDRGLYACGRGRTFTN